MSDYSNLRNPIIFIGTGRSGTTIISEMVNRHPDLAFPSNYQEHFPTRRMANLARSLFDNPLWRIFGQKKQLNQVSLVNKYAFKPSEAYAMWDYLTGPDVDFSRGFLLDEELSQERIDFIRAYFHSLVKLQRRKRLAIKITGPARIGFLLQIFPDALFIHLTRNLIPTVNSFLKTDFWGPLGKERLWWTGAYTKDERDWAAAHADNAALLTAFQLHKVNQITEEERKRHQPRFMEVRYEDFVADPEKELQRIVDFTGLPPYDFQRFLRKVKIHNRNKRDTDYFSAEELASIYQVTSTELH